MTISTSAIREITNKVGGTITCEPAIRPSFGSADMPTIAAVTRHLIDRNVNTADRIYSYFAARGCKYDRDVIDFMLDRYTGSDPWECFWVHDATGTYILSAPLDL